MSPVPERSPVTSLRNPAVKRLRELLERPRRAGGDVFVAEGVKLVGDALAAGAPLVEAVTSPRLDRDARGAALRGALVRLGIAELRVADRVLDALSDAATHQGVIALVRRPAPDPAGLLDPVRRPFLVLAAGVQDPGNAGALVRVADALGASALLAAGGADPWGPRAVRAAAGSLFRLPVAAMADPVAAAAAARAHGYRLVAAVANGGEPPERARLGPPVALVVGSEGADIPAGVLELAGARVQVRLRAGVESLNVAAAAAVLLHAAGWLAAADPARP